MISRGLRLGLVRITRTLLEWCFQVEEALMVLDVAAAIDIDVAFVV